ncbi:MULTISPECIES: sensor histidine kinase [Chitinophagaceae]
MTVKDTVRKDFLLKFIFVLFLNIAIGNNGLWAQDGLKYVITNYTSENGLPQNSVKDILFDKSGFCWLATESGIVRFDNRSFKVFGGDNIKGLKSDRMVIMRRTISGEIYAQNNEVQDIAIVQESNNAPKPVLYSNSPYYNPAVGYLTANKTAESSFIMKSTKADPYPMMRNLTSLGNEDLYREYGGSLFYIHGTHIQKISDNKLTPKQTAPLGDSSFIEFWTNRRVVVWQKGIRLLEHVLSDDNTAPSPAGKRSVNGGLLWCPTGTFWYQDHKLYQLTLSGSTLQCILLMKDLPFDFPSSIYYDPSANNFYVGTSTQGLFVITISDFHYPAIPTSVLPNFYTLLRTSKDAIVTANTIIPHGNSKAYPVALNNVNGVASYIDAEDRIYYESEYALCRYDLGLNKIDTLIPLLDSRLRSIFPVPSGTGYIACTGHAITCISNEGKVIWKKNLSEENTASVLYPLDRNNYLLGTVGGLKWYNLERSEIFRTILKPYKIKTVYNDSIHHQLWIGTDGSGSFLYENGKVYRLPLGPQKAFKSIHSFIPDGKGAFWLPTNNGLFRVDQKQLTDDAKKITSSAYFYMFNKKNGLHTNEFNGGGRPAYQWLSDSTLVLPSIDGMVEFQPNHLRISYPDKPIYVDEIILNKDSSLSLGHDNTIQLQPNFKTLELSVSCPYFGNSENLQLEYAIQTSSNIQWNPVPGNGQIIINTLPSGSYHIVIRKVGGGHLTNASLEILLDVLPPFYNQWWFRILAIALVLISFWTVLQFRTKKMQKEHRRIENLVEVRTAELNKTIKMLEQSEESLKQSEVSLNKSNILKDQIITMVLHDLRSPISFLGTISRYLSTHFREMRSEEVSGMFKDLNTSIGSMKNFMEQFFSWATSQRENFQIKKTHFPVQEIFDEMVSLYQESVTYNNNKLIVEQSNLTCFSDKQILSMVLRNILDNANKNTKDGRIRISAERHLNQIYILISDNGRGMTQDHVDRFIKASQGTGESGIGTMIILSMLQKLNGTLNVQSELGKGSLFAITVPER